MTQAEQPDNSASVDGIVALQGLFVLAYAATTSLCFVLIRRHLGSGIPSTLVALLCLAALIGAIVLALGLRKTAPPGTGIALGATLGYALPVAGIPLGRWIAAPLVALAVAGMARWLRLLRRQPWPRLLLAILLGAGCAFLLFLYLNGSYYAHVFEYEYVQLGLQPNDGVFHGAIAELFKTYGIPTVGLNGTPLLVYHVGSHLIVAGISGIAGEGVLLAYPPVQQILFIPALLLGASLMVSAFSNWRTETALAAPALLVLVWFVWDYCTGFASPFLSSESYIVALGLFCFGLPLALQGPRGKGALWSWYLPLALSALVSSLAKFTLALAWAIAGALGLLRRDARQAMPGAATAVLVLLAAAAYGVLVLALYFRTEGAADIGLFPYFQTFPRMFYVGAGTVAVALAASAWLSRVSPAAPSPLVLLVLALLLHLPDVFVNAEGGAAYYWNQPAAQVSAAVIVATIILAAARVLGGSMLREWAVLLLVFLATFATAYRTEAFVPYTNLLASNLVAFDRLAAMDSPPPLQPASARRGQGYVHEQFTPDLPDPWTSTSLPAFFRSVGTVLGHIATGTDGRVTELLADTTLARATLAARQAAAAAPLRVLAYIPPDAAWHWTTQRECMARNFAFQALTGLALVAGLAAPDDLCGATRTYGLAPYGPDALNRPMDDDALCAAATSLGYRGVIRMAPDASASLLHC